jgi:hypothetical protein
MLGSADLASLMEVLHKISCVLCFQKRIHGVDQECDICHNAPVHQSLVEKMCMDSISRFSNLVQARLRGVRSTFTLHTGHIVDGIVRAVVPHTDGVKLQVDYGNDETALVELWRVQAR